MRYLIIGNGVAGTTAAEHIRLTDPVGEITVLSAEPSSLYSRIRLIDYLAGTVQPAALTLKKPEWYEQRSISLRLNESVTVIDAEDREVLTDEGSRFGFDRLLLATGSRCFVPPIKGAEAPGVFTLRTISDARAMAEFADRRLGPDAGVAIIGGGVLGLEVGNALRLRRGCSVLVVEFFPRLLPRQMDPEGSRILCARMQQMGYRFFLGAKTERIEGNEAGFRLVLDDGRSIEAAMVVISAGVRAETTLAEAMGVECGSLGIKVDDTMRTSLEGVFAAGDAAEHRGVAYGLWQAAEQEGRVAGINMAGGEAAFKGITPSNVLKVAGIELAASGDIDADGKCEHMVHADGTKHKYVKLVHRDGTLMGCIILGTKRNRGKILRAVSEGRSVESVREDFNQMCV